MSGLRDSVVRADLTKPDAARGARVGRIIAGEFHFETAGELPRGGRLRPSRSDRASHVVWDATASGVARWLSHMA